MVLFLLCTISIIEVFSASSMLTYKGGNYLSPIIKHAATIICGIFMAVLILNIDCRYFKIATVFLLFISFFTLIYVLLWGKAENDASRWIGFAGFQFQPSELAKGTLVLATAQVLSAMQTENGADKKTMKYILYLTVPFLVLIAGENLSTAVLLGAVILMMMFIGHVPMRQIGKLLGVIMIGVVAIFTFVMVVGDEEEANSKQQLTEKTVSANGNGGEVKKKRGGILHRADTWKERIKDFLNSKEVPPEEYDLAENQQVGYANIAIASSHIVGKMPGNSEARDFLPQAFSDFIYAIIIEEMGIWGAAIVALLYIILLFQSGRIAARCANKFPAYLVMGLALLMVTQALFNMAVAVGLAPVTGQPLPLVSKGGSSTVFCCIYIGAILSVSRSAKQRDDISDNRKKKPAYETVETN
ncbi:MAG: FtsW/RodA/SpoVE family cell cycle protein [Prevotella sp.]|nr:FtsW/RodA/SpoVE family cell cycle protein [Prevotella sp.]